MEYSTCGEILIPKSCYRTIDHQINLVIINIPQLLAITLYGVNIPQLLTTTLYGVYISIFYSDN